MLCERRLGAPAVFHFTHSVYPKSQQRHWPDASSKTSAANIDQNFMTNNVSLIAQSFYEFQLCLFSSFVRISGKESEADGNCDSRKLLRNDHPSLENVECFLVQKRAVSMSSPLLGPSRGFQPLWAKYNREYIKTKARRVLIITALHEQVFFSEKLSLQVTIIDTFWGCLQKASSKMFLEIYFLNSISFFFF